MHLNDVRAHRRTKLSLSFGNQQREKAQPCASSYLSNQELSRLVADMVD